MSNGTQQSPDYATISQRWQERSTQLTALAEFVMDSPLRTATGAAEPELHMHIPVMLQLRDRTLRVPSMKTLSPIPAVIIALSADAVHCALRRERLPEDFSGAAYRVLAEFSFGRVKVIDAELTVTHTRNQVPDLVRFTASFLRLAPEVRVAIRRRARRQASRAR